MNAGDSRCQRAATDPKVGCTKCARSGPFSTGPQKPASLLGSRRSLLSDLPDDEGTEAIALPVLEIPPGRRLSDLPDDEETEDGVDRLALPDALSHLPDDEGYAVRS